MNAAELIRETMRGFDEFTVADVYAAVKDRIRHLKEPSLAVGMQISLARDRGEIQEIGKRRIGSKSTVKVWRKVGATPSATLRQLEQDLADTSQAKEELDLKARILREAIGAIRNLAAIEAQARPLAPKGQPVVS
jgi:hypothetical protein